MSNPANNSNQARECPEDGKLASHTPRIFWIRLLMWLIRLSKHLCCAFSIIWLGFVVVSIMICITTGLTPVAKAMLATTSVAAVIPILLLLNGKWKYLIGIPCLLVASWIVLVMWQTRDELNIGSRIGKEANLRLREIAIALDWYSERWGRLPFPERRAALDPSADWHDRNGEGAPLYSWRVEILPLPRSWNPADPWNAAANHDLFKRWLLFSYRLHPDDDSTIPHAMALAITGPGTAFGDGTALPVSLRDVPPDTILVVEAKTSGIPWPAPGDFDIRTMQKMADPTSIWGLSARGFQVVFADKQVWLLSKKIPFETLERFFTVDSADIHDREELLGPYALGRYP